MTISKNSEKFSICGDTYMTKNYKIFELNLKKWRRKKLFWRRGVGPDLTLVDSRLNKLDSLHANISAIYGQKCFKFGLRYIYVV